MQVSKELNVQISLQKAFSLPTIQQLGNYIEQASQELYTPIRKLEKHPWYRASSVQKRLYILQHLDNVGITYNLPYALILAGDIKVDHMKKAIQTLINRHEALRTSFMFQEGEVVQQIHDGVVFDWTPINTKYDTIDEMIEAFIQPFSLDMESLFRAGITRLEPNRYLLVLDMHHIISDGTSSGILINELMKLYQNPDVKLSPVNVQYKEFAAWQHEFMQSGRYKKQEKYWLEKYRDGSTYAKLPTDYARPPVQSFNGERISFQLDEEATRKLKKLAREHNVTLYMTLLAAYKVLLYKYTSNKKIVVGTPTIGRRHPDIENTVGMFVNTLALMNTVNPNESFKSFLERLKKNTLEAFDNQDYQFEDLVRDLGGKRELSNNPLFDTMFILQNTDGNNLNNFEGVFSDFKPYSGKSKFDLSIEVYDRGKNLDINITFCKDLFRKDTIETISSCFLNIIKQINKDISTIIRSFNLLNPLESQDILKKANTSEQIEKGNQQHFIQLFEKTVKNNPYKVAVVERGKSITYDELDKKSTSLAYKLKCSGISKGQIVGIILDSSIELITSILGIMKAGAAYLPIETNTPLDRILYILENSNASLVLTDSKIKITNSINNRVINVNELNLENHIVQDKCILTEGLNESAYIIYTSGTTGLPKGVNISHLGLSNYVTWFSKFGGVCKEDKTILLSSFAFDLGYTSLYPILANGGTLHLLTKDYYMDPKNLINYIDSNCITYLKLTPSLYSILNDYDPNHQFQSLRLIIFGGEPLNIGHVKNINRVNNIRIVNHYGPTETTIGCIAGDIHLDSQDITRTYSSIGKPIFNMTAYIVDEDLNMVPSGVPGELCISGVGVAKGYINQPDLTNEKFISNPFQEGQRLYRTGDLARWLPDGNIEFLGRTDHQVKIRGYRIETAEIEQILLTFHNIKDALVIPIYSQVKEAQLCAYICSHSPVSIQELRRYLMDKLPDYMIPAYFVRIEQFPLTPNGKVDRKALPEPERIIDTGRGFVPAVTIVEKELEKIWCEILDLEGVSILDNFFELGGDSLKIARMVMQVSKELNVQISLQKAFSLPTIQQLGNYIEQASQELYTPIRKLEKHPWYRASSVQKRLYILQHLDNVGITYNLPYALILAGDIKVDHMKKAIQTLINRHEALRTSFMFQEGEVIQQIHDGVVFDWTPINTKYDTIDEMIEAFIQPFSLDMESLFRAGITRLEPNRYLLVLDMHHIISDGTSSGILINELMELYQNPDVKLSPVKVQYKEFAAWQHKFMQSGGYKEQEKYWLEKYRDGSTYAKLPTDYVRPPIQSFNGERISFQLGEEITKQLKALAKEHNVTLYMILLAAYKVFLYKYTNNREIVVGTPTTGRRHPDIQNTVGMFVNTLALVNSINPDESFKSFLDQLKESSLEAFDNQDYQFEDLVRKLGEKYELSNNPLFDTMFAFQNMESFNSQFGSYSLSIYDITMKISKFDMSLYACETDNYLKFDLEYNVDLFKEETMKDATEYLKEIYCNLNEFINRPIGNLISLHNSNSIDHIDIFEDDFNFI
ncbi:non-ribosomal peptide synthetase [Bacillus pseudomycoides]|uniref:non-ribosomal peptide synthetase n=1 Tax=Bacillus pseudomycoides TaxID=64104 RepID=UPI001FB43751|nr:non-ribosomal peptide synthetase [Bacillus pseudomycoides]